jgi:hypothetical protein
MSTTAVTTNTNTTPLARLRQLLPTAIVIAGTMILTAPAAYAVSEEQIKNTCEANGGTYATHVAANGNTVSQCCYHSHNPPNLFTCDYYLNGDFDGSQQFNQPPPGTTMPPTHMTPAPGAIPQGKPLNHLSRLVAVSG